MALPVTSARPQQLGMTQVAQPGRLGATSSARPGSVSVSSNYGLQGYGPAGSSAQPLTIGGGLRQLQQSANQGSSFVDTAYRENMRLQSQVQSLLASLRPAAPAPIDIAAINAQARKQAEESVNPLYTKKLNDMLARQSVKRQRAQQDYELGVQNTETALQQALKQNEIERGRTAEDVTTNIDQLATAEDQFQTASGQELDEQRIAQAGELAAAGLTTSGIGRQQAQRLMEQSNLSEKQKTEEFQAQRSAQALLKARTFDDLARSDLLSGERAEKGKQSLKLDLDRLIEDVGREEETEKFNIENERLDDISGRTSGFAQSIFNNYLASIRDPRTFEATARAYGGLF